MMSSRETCIYRDLTQLHQNELRIGAIARCTFARWRQVLKKQTLAMPRNYGTLPDDWDFHRTTSIAFDNQFETLV